MCGVIESNKTRRVGQSLQAVAKASPATLLATVLAAVLACVLSLLMYGSAFALSVSGADHYGTDSTIEGGDVEVLSVQGALDDSVFVTVKRDGRIIAQALPYVLGNGNAQGYGSEWSGVITLDITGYDTSQLDGSYSIEAYATHDDDQLLYSGSLFGVYAQLPDGTTRLIGTRTVNETDEQDRVYTPADTLYVNGVSYKRSGDPHGSDALYFPYEAYSEASTVDGALRFVDKTGAVLTTKSIPGIPYNGNQKVTVPSTITAESGELYRTVYFRDSVTAKNPGQSTFTVPCVKMADADKAAAHYYVATIKMVDEEGRVIASDTVNVTGDFSYTVPQVIYKNMLDETSGKTVVNEYTLKGEDVIRLSAANDGVTTGERVLTVPYKAVADAVKQTHVTFTLLDGSKRAGDKGRVLGTFASVVSKDTPRAVPQASVSVGGADYRIAGSPDDYAFTFGSGKLPVVNVYYLPADYEAPGAYNVTVNYVDFLTGSVVDSVVYKSDPDQTAAQQFDTPASFEKGGITYLRLDGQDDAISHSYYSGITAYTVYYRDKNDTLTSGSVINRIRVVYRDGGTTNQPGSETTDAQFSAGQTSTVPGAVAQNASGGAGSTTDASGAAGTDAANLLDSLQLDLSRLYNVFDGLGNNGSLTNEEGIDSNSERIDDDANPLASGLEGTADEPGAAAQGTNTSALLQPLAVVGGLVVLAVVGALVLRTRRKRLHNDQESEA